MRMCVHSFLLNYLTEGSYSNEYSSHSLCYMACSPMDSDGSQKSVGGCDSIDAAMEILCASFDCHGNRKPVGVLQCVCTPTCLYNVCDCTLYLVDKTAMGRSC